MILIITFFQLKKMHKIGEEWLIGFNNKITNLKKNTKQKNKKKNKKKTTTKKKQTQNNRTQVSLFMRIKQPIDNALS